MKEKTIKNFIKHLKASIEQQVTMKDYCKAQNLSSTYLSDTWKRLLSDNKLGKVNQELFKEALTLKEESAKIVETFRSTNLTKYHSSKTDDDIEMQRNKVLFNRDDNDLIDSYSFEITIHNKPTLSGTLSREEMNMIYRLYSNYGSSLTQREVSRFFPEFSLYDFKRILKAFNITKASAQFAPHIIEETSQEDLLEMAFREKENDFLRSLEVEKVRRQEQQVKDLYKENTRIKEEYANKIKEVEDLIKLSPAKHTFVNSDKGFSEKNDLIIFLSDMHVGAYNDRFGVYSNDYNEDEIWNRLSKIINTFKGKSYNDVVCVNLGDSIDSCNDLSETSRGGHKLPTQMTAREQSELFISLMFSFFTELKESIKYNYLSYYSVSESNHDGSRGWLTNVALSYKLQSIGINTSIAEKSIEPVYINKNAYILLHGRDNSNQFKNFPLVLNEKVENYFDEYIREYKINPENEIFIVKGDLHQYATTTAKQFTYVSVGSLYGSSNWVQANFGNTKWCISYSEINNEGSSIWGLIK